MHHHQVLTKDSTSRDSRVEFVCKPQRAAEARDAIAAFLEQLDPPPRADAVQNLLLLVSELVTNAIRHAGGVCALRLAADRRVLQIRVSDHSSAHPQDRTPDLTGRTGGFGWPMIRRLAHDVQVRSREGGGKVVVATVAR
ncbi:ATP-binding protein [Streptomyces sp. NPDC008125]|uniref:ATP-binding protein n=1 Tax=Streptomyces sp. NPDC008125 TaxID=3364811 RepID=UPI0036F0245F